MTSSFLSRRLCGPFFIFEEIKVKTLIGYDLRLNGRYNPLVPSLVFNFRILDVGAICRYEVNSTEHNGSRTHKHAPMEEDDPRRKVPVHYFSIAAGKHWDLETKFANRRAHPIHGLIVLSWVAGIFHQAFDWPVLDGLCRGRDHCYLPSPPLIAVADFSRQTDNVIANTRSLSDAFCQAIWCLAGKSVVPAVQRAWGYVHIRVWHHWVTRFAMSKGPVAPDSRPCEVLSTGQSLQPMADCIYAQ